MYPGTWELEQAGPIQTRQLVSCLLFSALKKSLSWQWEHTECGGCANDDTLALDLLGKVNLVARRVLNQDVEIRDGVSFLDEGRSGVVEEGPLGQGAREGGSEAASSEHDGCYVMLKGEVEIVCN